MTAAQLAQLKINTELHVEEQRVLEHKIEGNHEIPDSSIIWVIYDLDRKSVV